MFSTLTFSDALLAAVIAGAVSIIVSVIGYVASSRKLKSDTRKFQVELESKWIEKIYAERFRLYPEAFKITSLILKRAAPEFLPPRGQIDDLRNRLNVWASEAGLFMSRDTAKAYMDLRQALGKRPGHGEFYTREQGEKVWRCRNEFRRCLRKDVGNIYVDDDNAEVSDYWEVL